MELFRDTNFDFLGKKWPFIIASLVLTTSGLISLAIHGGPRYGIDFRGGTSMTVKFAKAPNVEQLRPALAAKIPGGNISVVEAGGAGSNEILIETELKNEKELDVVRRNMVTTLGTLYGSQSGKVDINNASAQVLVDRLREALVRAGAGGSETQMVDMMKAIVSYRDTPPRSGLLKSIDELSALPGVTPAVINVLKQETDLGQFTIRGVAVVGPKIGGELRQKAFLATLYALAGMMVYLWIRFEWIYGLAAVIAVFHDTIITVGLFSLFNKEIDLTVVAALLTLVGYSMNDTIVVYDRIRENQRLNRRESLEWLINRSVNQTLSRTILTGGLTFLTCACLLIFGGPVLHGFSFALVMGILVGTYSSIFVASPILVFWQNYMNKKRKEPSKPAASAAPVMTATPKAMKSVK